MTRASFAHSVAVAAFVSACAPAADPDEPVHTREPVATVTSALTPTDPVSQAVSSECSTASVAGLSRQLVDEIQCLRPGTMASIESAPGLSLGSAVFPALQAPAAAALLEAQKARGVTMTINSALRTLPQQYLLYRWYQTGRCNISLAASPGKSNHESGLAVDIDDSAGWRTSMTNAGFKWLGASDPVHYDFAGAGVVDMSGLSVQAFQRLWNRNHPEDPIDEDGKYGASTEERLAKSPVGGFARGAECSGDAGVGPPPADADTDAAPPELPASNRPSLDDGGGCSCRASTPARDALSNGACVLLVALALTRRRSRRRG
jgi:hypothetical protein